MDFEFTDQQNLIKNTVKRVLSQQIEPLLDEYPKDAPLPKEAVLKIGQFLAPLGFQGARIPVADGGSGLDYVSLGIMAENLPFDVVEPVQAAEGVASLIYFSGSEELKNELLPLIVGGKVVVSYGVAEPNVGSDSLSMESRARLEGNEYVLNGIKMWISNADIADWLSIVAWVKTGQDSERKLMCFIVDGQTSAIEIKVIPMMGLKRQHICQAIFDDCRVPAKNIIGAQGGVRRSLVKVGAPLRPLIALFAIHYGQRALDASLRYAQERKQYGKVIGSFQLIQDKIVEMTTLVEASRLLAYKALSLLDKGVWCPMECSMAKQFATESMIKVTSLAVQIHGAYGLTEELPVAGFFRNARMLTIDGGTTDIQRLMMGHDLLGIPAFY